MKLSIPNLKEILKPEASHKPGYGIDTYTGKFHKQDILEQGSTPEDNQLLRKLGISKKDKILAIAGYYASWASRISKLGANVDYSDISSSMVKFAKNEYRGVFGKYICSNYELIPKLEREYDWTFTFEACGGKRGLCIAYLRSLLNTKGGILVLLIRKKKPEKMGSKLKQYPLIVKTLSKLYKCKYSVKIVKIKSHIKGQRTAINNHQISRIITNNNARNLAELDLSVLSYISKKRKIKIPEACKKLGINKARLIRSIRRLNKLAEICMEERFRRDIALK